MTNGVRLLACCVIACSTPPDEMPFEPGLIVSYMMDDDPEGGRVRDGSGHGHDARCAIGINCPTAAAGVHGAGIELDGTSETLHVIGTPVLATDSLTIAVWVRPAALPPTAMIATQPILDNKDLNTWGLVGFDERPCFETASATVCASTPFEIDRWVHLTGVVAPGQLDIYVDGVATIGPAAPAIAPSSLDLLIGGDLSNGKVDGLFRGRLDELRIYDRALSAIEIAELAGL